MSFFSFRCSVILRLVLKLNLVLLGQRVSLWWLSNHVHASYILEDDNYSVFVLFIACVGLTKEVDIGYKGSEIQQRDSLFTNQALNNRTVWIQLQHLASSGWVTHDCVFYPNGWELSELTDSQTNCGFYWSTWQGTKRLWYNITESP